MIVTPRNHTPPATVVMDPAENTNFIDKTNNALRELLKSLKKGLKSVEPRKRLWISPTLQMHSVDKIIGLWDKCLGAILDQQGERLLESITELMKAQGEHPVEFDVLISKMERMKMRTIFRYLEAVGNVFLMYETYSWDDQPLRDFYLKKAVQLFHKAGVSKDDPTLERYRQIFASSTEIPKL